MQASLGSTRLDRFKDYTLYLSDGNNTYFGSKLRGLLPPLEVVRHRAGGDPSISLKSPGRFNYEPVTLNRGVTADQSFSNWASQVVAELCSANVAEYRDGSDSTGSPRKLPHWSGFEDITLKRGVVQDPSFNSWANSVWSYGSSSGSEVPPASYRKDIFLQVYNQGGQWVVRYQIGHRRVLEFRGGGQGVFHHPLFPGGIQRRRQQLEEIFESSLDDWIKRKG